MTVSTAGVAREECDSDLPAGRVGSQRSKSVCPDCKRSSPVVERSNTERWCVSALDPPLSSVCTPCYAPVMQP